MKNKKLEYGIVAMIMVGFFIALALCLYTFDTAEEYNMLLISTGTLSSTLMLFTIVYAVMIMKKETSASEQYKQRFMEDEESEEKE